MAGRLLDSFDAYLTADILLRWSSILGSGIAISSGNGRNGTSSLRETQQAQGVVRTLDAQATWVMGFGYRTTSLTSGGGYVVLAALLDAGSVQCDLRLMTDGTLQVTRNGTQLGRTTNAILTSSFYYIEWKILINGSTGTVDIRVNGSSWLSLTGQNTQATANATANQIQLGGGGNSTNAFTADFDDLYICDGTGAANNTFLGDCRVQATLPNGAGHSTQFTATGAASNWQCVDQSAEDGDTTYVSSATAGQIDCYTFGSVTPTSGTVPFIQTMIVARKDDAGTRTIADVISNGTTNSIGTNVNIGTTYAQYLTIHETDPIAAGAWTITNVNGRQYGIDEVA